MGTSGWSRQTRLLRLLLCYSHCGLSRPLRQRISDAWKTNKKGIKSHLSQGETQKRNETKRNQPPQPLSSWLIPHLPGSRLDGKDDDSQRYWCLDIPTSVRRICTAYRMAMGLPQSALSGIIDDNVLWILIFTMDGYGIVLVGKFEIHVQIE